MSILERAIFFATQKHEGQRRKAPEGRVGLPYITHPLDVMTRLIRVGVTDERTLAAAVLHDVLEDTETTEQELIDHFGEEVAAIVVEVSDPPGMSKTAAKKRQVHMAPTMSDPAKLVKTSDKTSNVDNIITHPPGWTPDAIVGYTESAKRVVTAIGPTHPLLEQSFWRAYQLVQELRAVGALTQKEK